MSTTIAKVVLEDLFLFLIGFAGVVAVLAILSPRLFRVLSTRSSSFIDSARFLAFFDKSVNVDGFFLRYPRALGVLVLASVATLAMFYWRM